MSKLGLLLVAKCHCDLNVPVDGWRGALMGRRKSHSSCGSALSLGLPLPWRLALEVIIRLWVCGKGKCEESQAQSLTPGPRLL